MKTKIQTKLVKFLKKGRPISALTYDASMVGLFQITDGHPEYTKNTKFYVKLMTLYWGKSECPFPNLTEWYVEGVVEAAEKGAHKVCFPVFGYRILLIYTYF